MARGRLGGIAGKKRGRRVAGEGGSGKETEVLTQQPIKLIQRVELRREQRLAIGKCLRAAKRCETEEERVQKALRAGAF